MNIRLYIFICMAGLLAAGCAQEAGKPTNVTTTVSAQKPVIMQPFRFHKMVEVSPGNDFDVLSWGRGSSETGSFEILHSDSAGMKYTTTTGDLDGSIVDVYNTDMDVDGNPEILIQAKASDTSNYAIIYAFEFSNDKADKLDFPKLTKSQKKGYRGGDNFFVQDGNFMRQFTIYDGDGKDAKPTGQKRLLQYGLRNNEFTVKQVSKDSTTVSNTETSAPVVKSNSTTNTSSTSKTTSSSKNNSSSHKSSKNNSSSKKKKHKTEKHKTEEHKSKSHKKKKKHHHSDDND